jgi:hypothetical protein
MSKTLPTPVNLWRFHPLVFRRGSVSKNAEPDEGPSESGDPWDRAVYRKNKVVFVPMTGEEVKQEK